VQSSSFEVADVSVRSLNELTMKHFTDGEKVTTKAGTKKQSGWYSVNEDSRSTFSIYDVDYRTKFVQVTFKYRGIFKEWNQHCLIASSSFNYFTLVLS
jgi:hypothetical protein